MIDLDLFFQYLEGRCHGNQFCENGKLPTFVTLAFRNGSNSTNDVSISCENHVEFGPVTLELTELIIERLVRHSQKIGLFYQISPDVLVRFSQSFHHMRALGCRWWIYTLFSDLARNVVMATNFVKKMANSPLCCLGIQKRNALTPCICMI